MEALYAVDTNPIVRLFATHAIRSLAISLPIVVQNPESIEARSLALRAAWLCGKCLATTTVALHHKLCHVLGGSFNLPHAETHSVILPYALAYNAPKIPEVMALLAEALPDSNGDALEGLASLAAKLDTPMSLKDLGMKEVDINFATEQILSKPFWNPRDLEKSPIREMIWDAWNGSLARKL